MCLGWLLTGTDHVQSGLLVLGWFFLEFVYSYTHIYTHRRVHPYTHFYRSHSLHTWNNCRTHLSAQRQKRKKKNEKKAFSSSQQSRAIHHLTEILPVFKQLGRHDFQPKYLAWQTIPVLTDAFITTSFHLKFQYKRRWVLLGFFLLLFFFF